MTYIHAVYACRIYMACVVIYGVYIEYIHGYFTPYKKNIYKKHTKKTLYKKKHNIIKKTYFIKTLFKKHIL